MAISADATVLDLYLALLGAFGWRGDYDLAERDYYRVLIGPRVFEFGKGTRTPLRRVLASGTSFTVTTPDLAIDAQITNSYEVKSRRHFPKVIDGAGNFDPQRDTWRAQSAMRRELRGYGADIPIVSRVAPPEQIAARLHGFFSAVVSGPMIKPSEWLPLVIQMGSFADLQEVRDVVGGIMSKYNAVAQQLYERREEFLTVVEGFAEIGEGEGTIEWVRGYFDCIALRADEWQAFTRDERIRELFMPLVLLHFECGRDPNKRAWLRDPEFRGNISHAGALAAIGLWDEWRGRVPEPPQPGPVLRVVK